MDVTKAAPSDLSEVSSCPIFDSCFHLRMLYYWKQDQNPPELQFLEHRILETPFISWEKLNTVL